MTNITDKIANTYEVLFGTSKIKEYAKISSFLENDAEDCYDPVVSNFIRKAAINLNEAKKLVDINEKTFRKPIMLKNKRINKYKNILNFLRYEAEKDEGVASLFVEKSADDLYEGIQYLRPDVMNSRGYSIQGVIDIREKIV